MGAEVRQRAGIAAPAQAGKGALAGMQCVILCGGFGSRLREETEFRPKPMLPIGGRPILWHIMKGYERHGISDFLLVLGYRGETIKDYFLRYEAYNSDITVSLSDPCAVEVHRDHLREDWTVTLADTGEKTLKGGRLKRIEKYIEGDTFLLTYGDGVSDVDVGDVIRFHRSHGRIVTVTGVNPISHFGEMKLDGDRVVRFSEKSSRRKEYVSGGYFVCNRRLLDYLTPDDDCDLEYGALERLASEGEMMVYRHDGFWACMDNLRDYEYLNGLWNSGSPPWKTW